MTPDTDALLARIEAKREEVTALTQDLVRIPTVNPPGDAYEACARFIGERLSRRGFAVEYVRALNSRDAKIRKHTRRHLHDADLPLERMDKPVRPDGLSLGVMGESDVHRIASIRRRNSSARSTWRRR